MSVVDLKRDFQLERVRLRSFLRLGEADRERIRRWRNSDTVRAWMYADHVIDLDEHRRFLDRLVDDPRNFWWLVGVGDQAVGVVSLIRCDFRNRNAYLGIYVDPHLTGKGLAWITGYGALWLAFDVAGLHSLKLEVFADNEPAINLYSRLGFRQEGALRAFVERGGQHKDVTVMGMLAEEWRETRGRVAERAARVAASLAGPVVS